MPKFKAGDILKRVTEHNRIQIVKVIAYANGKYDDTVRVVPLKDLRECGEPFHLKESSLEYATDFDKIGNLNGKRMVKLLKPNWQDLFERMTKENLIEKWQDKYMNAEQSMPMLLETEEAQELSKTEMEYLLQWSGDDECVFVTDEKRIQNKG